MKEIKERISIRKFEEDEVTDEQIKRIVHAAMCAPSSANQQPWEFYVVRDKDTIEKLSQTCEFHRCATHASVIIVMCERTKDLPYPDFTRLDLAAATENALLEITHMGLGGVWLGVAPRQERIDFVDEVLGLREELHAFAMIPVGVPAKERKERDRSDRIDDSRIHYVG